MGRIVAIGGGEIGRPGFPVETTAIDKEIIRLTGKKHPRFLFVPTASSDAEGYVRIVRKHFGQRLRCRVSALLLVKEKPTLKLIRSKVMNSDIVYVGGGNTKKMLDIWRERGMDKILKEAYRKNIILAGVSAGAICWFKFASSDYQTLGETVQKKSYARIKGLNLVALTASPHHLREPGRKKSLIKIMAQTPGVGVALDDYAALEIVDDAYRIITSKPKSKAYKVFYQNKKLTYREIKKQKLPLPLSGLLKKN